MRHYKVQEVWGIRLSVVLVAGMGVINVLSAVTPSLAVRLKLLEHYLPLEVQKGGNLTAALAGFALLVLAGSLARRKRVAWMFTLAILGISAASHLVKGLDFEEAGLACSLILLLILMRSQFHARSDTPSLQQGLRVLGGAFVFTLAYGTVGFYLLDRHYSVNFGFWQAVRQTVVMFTEFYDPGLQPITHFGRYFADSIYIVGAVTAGYAVFMCLRPVFYRAPASQEERKRAWSIVENYGRSTLARLLLMNDKRYFFSSAGSLIGYVISGRAAVALGDPVGPPEDLFRAVEEFTSLCQHNDWMPVFYQTSEETQALYQRRGFGTLCIGHEGIVDLKDFSLEGKESKPLRAPINKIRNAGYHFMVHEPPIPDKLLRELRAISDEWLTMVHGSEKRFSLGWFDEDYIRNSRIAVVTTIQGSITAFANFIPEFQRNEISIDLMRRRHEIENGTMEFLFVSMFQWAVDHGFDTFNLGLSALTGVGGSKNDPAIERVMHFAYENLNQFYNFKGLHAFKEKFHPRWSPRYIVYPGITDLTAALIAVIQANSGSKRTFPHADG